MAYDEQLAARVRRVLERRRGISEKRMFGGICFLVRGNMCCGVVGGELVVRVGPGAYAEALARPYARPMDFTGKPLKGFVFVSPEGLGSPRALRSWVDRGERFARSRPARAGISNARGSERGC
jgi:TfoX/Sxy family transcriptional regulator of competence genes